MERTLLLNITYEPLRIISWQKAVTLLTLGKVEIVETYNRHVRSISFSIPLPSVVRLLYLVKRRPQEVKFSRKNIYTRDDGQCQYCGKPLQPKEITYDHVIPNLREEKPPGKMWSPVVLRVTARKAEKPRNKPE